MTSNVIQGSEGVNAENAACYGEVISSKNVTYGTKEKTTQLLAVICSKLTA